MTPKSMFFTLLGTAIGLIAIGGGVYYYFNSSLVTLNQEVGELLAEQEVIGLQIDVYEATEEQVEDLEFVEELANSVLPADKEQANVIAEIKQFVSEAGLQIEQLSFNTSATTGTGLSLTQTEAVANLPGVRVLPATVVISQGARYEDALRLLRKIENNQRKMQVTEVSLSPIPGSNRLATITLKLNIYLRGAAPQPTEQAPTTPQGGS